MSRRTSIVTAVVAIVVVVALLAVVLSRWNGAVGRSATVGVPVMWVSLGDDGAMNGGVSTVGVTVNQTGSADAYSVDLNVSTSGSTGKTWDASAASAAAVAMLYSAQDPRGVQVAFKVDDAINGSSAGGALTVGVLAALRGTNLKSGVTMTGTISPDGSIGSVDGVEAKVRGAAAAGYTRVMVPTASTTSAQPTKPTASASGTASATPTASATGTAPSTSGSSETSAVDVAVLSSELGIEVWAVSTVGEAYQGFTGRDVAAPAASAPALAAGFGGLVDAQVTSAQTALDADLAVAIKAGTVTAAQGSAARAQLAASREQAAKGERANAYATAIAALVVVDQQVAGANAAAVVKAHGSAQAAAAQIAQAKAQAGRAETALAASSTQAANTSPVQQIAAVASMTWLTKSVAVLRTISKELAASGGTVASEVLEAAAVNAQYRIAVERIFPDSFALALALAPSPTTDRAAMAAFIGGYSDLLSTAGAANQRYYEAVLTSIASSPGLTFSQPGHLYGAVQQLQALSSASTRTPSSVLSASAAASASAASASASAASASASATAPTTSATSTTSTTPTPTPSENVANGNYLARSAWDFSYYTMSQYLVSADQAYGLTGTGIGNLAIQATDSGALGIALLSGTGTVDAYSAQLAGYGIDPDHGLWAAQSGNALAGVGGDTRHETASTATGLQLVWDGAIETFMGNAAHTALGA